MNFFKNLLDVTRGALLVCIIAGIVLSVWDLDFGWMWLSAFGFLAFVLLAQIKISPKKGIKSDNVVELKQAESFSQATERKLTNGMTKGLNSTRVRNKRGQFAKKK